MESGHAKISDMVHIYIYIHTHVCVLEMQQYINISPYRDTLGGDTVSIHI